MLKNIMFIRKLNKLEFPPFLIARNWLIVSRQAQLHVSNEVGSRKTELNHFQKSKVKYIHDRSTEQCMKTNYPLLSERGVYYCLSAGTFNCT